MRLVLTFLAGLLVLVLPQGQAAPGAVAYGDCEEEGWRWCDAYGPRHG